MSDELPEGWAPATLGQLLANGLFADGDWVESKDQDPSGDVRLIQLADVGDGKFRNRSARFLTSAKARELGCTALERNDVLIARMPEPLGRACMFPGDQKQCVTVVDVCVARPSPGTAEAKWLMYAVNARQFRGLMEEFERGTTRKRISRSNLGGLTLALPPLAEQRRIVAKVEALLARVNAARERLEKVPLLLKRFRQSVLAKAFRGELTEEWREQNDVSSDWGEALVEQLAAVGTGSTPLRSNAAFFAARGTPWITSAATGSPFVTQAEEFVTAGAITAHRLKTYPVGTLLVAMYGEGKTRGQVAELRLEATINQACAAVVVDETRAVRDFVKLALEASYYEMRDMAEGGNQPNLNLTKIKEFLVPLPQIAEQRQIVSVVRQLLARADSLEGLVKRARAALERAPQAILQKAFEGELVPTEAELARGEGREFENAEELLRRVTRVEGEKGAALAAKGRGRARKTTVVAGSA